MQDGVPEVVSEVPRSIIGENAKSEKLFVSDYESGSVFIASLSHDKLALAQYDPRVGPIGKENIREVDIDTSGLQLVWESEGAVLFEVDDDSRAEKYAILDLAEFDFSENLSPSAELIYFCKQDADASDDEKTTYFSILRSGSGYVAAGYVGTGDQQKLSISDINSFAGQTPHTIRSEFKLPDESDGNVLFVTMTPDPKQIFVETLNNLFVFDLKCDGFGKEKSTVSLSNTVDISDHTCTHSTTGWYCEAYRTGQLFDSFSFVLKSDSAHIAGIGSNVMAGTRTEFLVILPLI